MKFFKWGIEEEVTSPKNKELADSFQRHAFNVEKPCFKEIDGKLIFKYLCPNIICNKTVVIPSDVKDINTYLKSVI